MGIRQWAATDKARVFAASALFAACLAPTFISYRPYTFHWDDADYLSRAVQVSRTFWVGNWDAVKDGMVSVRPPAMTLLGLPGGAIRSWDATGKCFITLAALIALLVCTCLYQLLRIGVKPALLIVAGICVSVSLGPFPSTSPAHEAATGFLADGLFAWTTLAALLLIPYEEKVSSFTAKSSVLAGLRWGLIFSLGTMTKINFLYFVILVVTILLFAKFKREGVRSVLAALIAFAGCCAPSAVYLIKWGKPIFENARASSYGGASGLYFVPFLQFIRNTFRESPGLVVAFLLMAFALTYFVSRQDLSRSWPVGVALLILIGFGLIVLAAPNRQIRYVFPVIVSLPFLLSIALSREGKPVHRRLAALAAALVFCTLLLASIPMWRRPDRQSLSRCEAVLALAARSNARSVLLATDSPTLNPQLMLVAIEFSNIPAPAMSTLAYQVTFGFSLEEDFNRIRSSDLVVFQERAALSPPFTNLRVPDYERFVREVGYGPVPITEDVSVYFMHVR